MDSIERLKNLFRKFPTVGPRTAGRFVFYLAKQPKERLDELLFAINELKNKIKLCQMCFNPFEGNENICQICSNPARIKNLLCVVEKEADLSTIENTRKYKGLYFILGGTVATMRKEDLAHLRIEELKARIKNQNLSEIIIAINPTVEGKATSSLIESVIKQTFISPAFKVTHLAKGIPVGGELEYADDETLESAFEGRR